MKYCLYPLLGLFGLCLSTLANAQNDVTAILGSHEPTANALTAGLEGTLNTLSNTQSTVDTSAALDDTLANTSSALAGVTRALGSLEQRPALRNADVQQNVDALALTNLENLVDLTGIEGTLKTLKTFDPNNSDYIVGLPFALPGLLLDTIEPTRRKKGEAAHRRVER